MKIFSQGNEFRYPTCQFICHECGCVFIATAAEYRKTYQGDVQVGDGTWVPEYHYRCLCPWCGNQVEKDVS